MKKGNKDLAALYPPYDKVTRGDVIAGRLKGKNKLQKEWSIYQRLGLIVAESLNLIEAEEPKPKPKPQERRKEDRRKNAQQRGYPPKGGQPSAEEVKAGMYRGK